MCATIIEKEVNLIAKIALMLHAFDMSTFDMQLYA